VLRTLLALGSSVALAACASNSNVEQSAAPAIGANPTVAAGSSPYPKPPAAVEPVAVAAAPVAPAPVPKPPDVAAKPEAPAPMARNVAMTRPPVPPPSPKQLIGKKREEIQALLGYPWLLKREGASELWQYRVTQCVLDVFLFADKGGEPKVSHVELRSRRENRAPPRGCYGEILESPRPAPNQTAKG